MELLTVERLRPNDMLSVVQQSCKCTVVISCFPETLEINAITLKLIASPIPVVIG